MLQAGPELNSKIQGSLVIIGGAARNENTEIWNEITRLAGKHGKKKKIAVFPCASRFPIKNGDRAISVLNTAGADAFLVPVDAEEIRAFAVEERRTPPSRVVVSRSFP